MGLPDLHGLIAAVPGLDDAARAAVPGGDAVQLFGLATAAVAPR